MKQNTEQLKKIEKIRDFIDNSELLSVAVERYVSNYPSNTQEGMINDFAKELLHLISSDGIKRDAVGVLAKGNQSGNATKESGVFFRTPNSGGLISVEKQKLFSLFTEWLDAMGWLGEFTSGQEKAIFAWFDSNRLAKTTPSHDEIKREAVERFVEFCSEEYPFGKSVPTRLNAETLAGYLRLYAQEYLTQSKEGGE